MDPLELKRAITARSVYAKAGAAERPVTASMFPALGVASKETSKVPFGLSIAVFCQLAELVTHGELETVTPTVLLAVLLLASTALTRIVCGPPSTCVVSQL